MKILVFGADGMLGHQLVESLLPRHDVAGTVRKQDTVAGKDAASGVRLFTDVDVRDHSRILDVVERFGPDAVVNAVGIVKQREEAKNAIESIEVNSLLPHRLAEVCMDRGMRLVHLSTDCVFTGEKGSYLDQDLPDARDMYGRSKMMGEVEGTGVVTLRTSIIGLELARKRSLIEWFLSQTGTIKGYRKAIYTGFTTVEMSRIIEKLLMAPVPAQGIYNVSSDPIDKYSLLCLLRDRLGKVLEIIPDDEFVCDRSLDSGRFRKEFNYVPPDWQVMLDELGGQIELRYGKQMALSGS